MPNLHWQLFIQALAPSRPVTKLAAATITAAPATLSPGDLKVLRAMGYRDAADVAARVRELALSKGIHLPVPASAAGSIPSATGKTRQHRPLSSLEFPVANPLAEGARRPPPAGRAASAPRRRRNGPGPPRRRPPGPLTSPPLPGTMYRRGAPRPRRRYGGFVQDAQGPRPRPVLNRSGLRGCPAGARDRPATPTTGNLAAGQPGDAEGWRAPLVWALKSCR
jgi:hypothetical protein